MNIAGLLELTIQKKNLFQFRCQEKVNKKVLYFQKLCAK